VDKTTIGIIVMKKCPFCSGMIKKEEFLCPLCRRDLTEGEPELRSIYFCPICRTEETYCDSTNRVFCPHCGNYIKKTY